MSTKRKRDSELYPSVQRLEEMMQLTYDKTMIDSLLQQHKAQEESSSTGADSFELFCCPREYENSFLREPVGSERLCARGKDCEALKIEVESPFILREFLYPNDTAKDSESRSLCLLCRRFEISFAYYKYETNPSSTSAPNLRISDHYNLVGLPGEYDIRDCIVSESQASGLVLPVVLHSRTAYTMETIDGIRHLAQTRMRFPNVDTIERGPFLMRRAALETKAARSPPRSAAVLTS